MLFKKDNIDKLLKPLCLLETNRYRGFYFAYFLRARSTRVLQYHHFMMISVILASSYLDGDSGLRSASVGAEHRSPGPVAPPYPRFPDHLKKIEMVF